MKNIIIHVFLLAFVWCSTQAQNAKPKNTLIEAVLKNEQGKPIANAKIFGNEGAIVVKTDENGRFSITTALGSALRIEADGYETKTLAQPKTGEDIALTATPFLMGEGDDADIAFGKAKRGTLSGDITVIDPNKMSDFDLTQSVPDALFGRVAGMFGNTNIRGLGNALVVLDGIPRYSSLADINLNMQEVEKITVLKDVNAVALYGAQARNGVIIISTKRGKPNKRDINITAYTGISKPRALPNYLGSADYMTLYNEALANDGLAPRFDAKAIENSRTGNPYRYPNVDYFSPENIKSYKTFSKTLAEFSGGNDNTTFYANFGWSRNGSLLNIGQGLNEEQNRFNSRANVNFKVSDFIKSNVDIAGIFDFNRGTNTNYWSNAATLRPHLYAPFLPMSLVNTKADGELAKVVDARRNEVAGALLGGTQQNTTNPFATLYAGGYSQPVRRTLQFNNGIDVDLSRIAKGLALRTNVSFDFYNAYNQTVSNTYTTYEPTWSATADSIIGLKPYGSDVRTGTQNVGSPDFLRRLGFSGQLNYDRTFGENHHFSSTLLAFVNTIKAKGTYQPDKNANLGLRLAYNYANTYFVDVSSAYVNSTHLPADNRTALSPTIALGWMVSNTAFLKNAKAIDYLKLTASAGVLNSDMNISGYYLYNSIYNYNSSSGTFTWADGTSNNITSSLNGPNNALGFEKRKEMTVGLEGSFFNRTISVDAHIFNTRITDKYTRENALFPSYFTDFVAYSNYGIDAYSGAELGLNYSKKMGDFGIDIGLNGMYWHSQVKEKSELFSQPYLYAKGRPVDAQFGWEALGLFQDAAEIKSHAFQTFGDVRPGDIKYKDQNGDGLIDNNDMVQIGRSTPPIYYGLNVKLSYKNVSLFALGVGANGTTGYNNNEYYWIDGENKYSEKVLGRWTQATKSTATYPRLSSKTNTNNFRNSTFWQYNSSYFSINRMQLTYEMPEKMSRKLAMNRLTVYSSVSNLAIFSKNETKDLNIGGEPFYRHYTLGIRAMF